MLTACLVTLLAEERHADCMLVTLLAEDADCMPGTLLAEDAVLTACLGHSELRDELCPSLCFTPTTAFPPQLCPRITLLRARQKDDIMARVRQLRPQRLL